MGATDVKVRLSVEGASQVGTEVDRVVGSVDRLSGALGRVAALGAAGAGIVAATMGVREMAAAIFDASAGAQRLRTQLDFATGGNSVKELAFVADMANRLGLEVNSTAKAYAGFAAAARGTAIEGEKTRQIFEAVSKASAVMGLSADESRGALLALQQMVSKGVVSAEEFRQQLGERMPIALGAGARALGVTTAEFSKLLETGQIIASDFLPKFAAQIEKDLGGAAEKAAARLDASVNRLANAWEKLKQQAGDAGASETMAAAARAASNDINAISESMQRAKDAGHGATVQWAQGLSTVIARATGLHVISDLWRSNAESVGQANLQLKTAETELTAMREALAKSPGNILLADLIKDTERLVDRLREANNLRNMLDQSGAETRRLGMGDTSFDTAETARFTRRAAQAKAQGEIFTKYATDAQRMRTELDQVRAAFGGVIPPGLEKQIREKFIKPTHDAVKEGRELVQALNLRAAGFDPKFLDDMKDLQAYAKASGMSTTTLQASIAKLIEQQPFAQAALKKTTAEVAAYFAAREVGEQNTRELNESETARTNAMLAAEQSLADRVAAVRDDVAASALATTANISLAEAIERVTLARMIEGRAALVNDPEKLASLDRQIEKQRQLVGLIAGADGKASLDSFLGTDKLQSFGTAFSDAFGRAGGAVTTLMQTLEAYGAQQQDLAKLSALAAKEGPEAQAKFATKAAQVQISSYASMAGAAKGFFKEGTKGYKAMEAAEKTFRAFELALAIKTTVEKLGLLTSVTTAKVAGDAAQTASAVASVAPEVAASMAKGQAAAVAGVANQAGGDPYTAFFRIAAMAALMAGLGFAVKGGGSAPSAKDRQAATGTGTVLGDASAKSESITKSIDRLADSAQVGLTYQSGMLAALRNIESTLAGVGTQVLRQGNINTGKGLGILEGTTPYRDTIGKGIATAGATMMGGAVLGALTNVVLTAVDKVIGPLWGKTKQEITDAGLAIRGTVADLVAGQGVSQYADVTTTKSSWFGLRKTSSTDTITQAVGDDMARQFGLVFANIGDVLQSSAVQLGKDGQTVGDAVAKFVVDIPTLSLKDLKGSELQDAIANAISAQADQISRTALPGLEQFQQVGEGYFETLVRVASGVETARYQLDLLGVSAIDYTEVTRTQGDVSAEIVRQSIVGFETLGGAVSSVGAMIATLDGSAEDIAGTYRALVDVRAQIVAVGGSGQMLTEALIRSAGGLDALQTSLSDYFDNFFSDAERTAAGMARMGEQLAALGIDTVPKTRAEFRALVEHVASTGEAGVLLASKIMALGGAFAALVPAEEAATVATSEVAAAFEQLAGGLASGVQAAYAEVVRQISQERQRLESSARDRINALDREADAAKSAFDRIADALRGLIDNVQQHLDTLAGNLAGDGGRGLAEQNIRAALDGARRGVALDPNALRSAVDAFSNVDASKFTSRVDYGREVGRTAALLREVQGAANREIDSERRKLTQTLGEIAAQQVAIEAELKTQTDRLDAQLKEARDAAGSLVSIDDGVQSLADAIMKLAEAMAAMSIAGGGPITAENANRWLRSGNTEVWGSSAGAVGIRQFGNADLESLSIRGLQSRLTGRQAVDWVNFNLQAGSLREIYDAAIREGIDSASLDGLMGWEPGTSAAGAESMGLPRFGYGGVHQGGGRIVGDRGPELEVTGPARIYSFEQLMQMARGGRGPDNGAEAMAASVDRMRAELGAAMVAVARHTSKFAALADRWEGAGMPPVRA